jgi:enterochelin esterase family protein
MDLAAAPAGSDAGTGSEGASGLGPWRAIVRSERMVEVESRTARSSDPAAAAARFWEGIAQTPLWERDMDFPGGWRATFLWRGAPEVTRHVSLCGPMVFSEQCGCLFEQIPQTDIWHLTLRLPAQTRAAYAISPNGLLEGSEGHDEVARLYATWVRDPLNPSTLVIPANAAVPEYTPRLFSVLEAPDAEAQRWRVPRPGDANGELQEHIYSSVALQNTRRVWTYTPAGWDPSARKQPLLLAFDGWDAVNVTRLPVVLDNLIAARAIPPTVAVLIDSGTAEMRARELDCHEPFVTFLADEALPWAGERWQLDLDRSRTIVAGISLGGRSSLFAGLRRPDLFGKVIAQSPAVTESEPVVLEALARRAPAGPSEQLEIYMDVGLLEIDRRGDFSFLPGARRFREILRATGHSVHYAELACGHDDIVVGETVAHGLELLIPREAD